MHVLQKKALFDKFNSGDKDSVLFILINLIDEQDKKIEALEKKVAQLDGENSLNRPLNAPPRWSTDVNFIP